MTQTDETDETDAEHLHRVMREATALIAKLSDVLTRTANALNDDPGPPPRMTWSNLPAKAQVMRAKLHKPPALDEFAEDTLKRARWALADNDGRPAGVWLTGEQLAVALVLYDTVTITRLGYTREEAARRVLAGMASGPDLKSWLAGIRYYLDLNNGN